MFVRVTCPKCVQFGQVSISQTVVLLQQSLGELTMLVPVPRR